MIDSFPDFPGDGPDALRTICAPPPCFCCGRYHEFDSTFEDVRRHLIRERAQEVLDRLNSLHRTRMLMQVESLYHAAYVDLAIRLNQELRSLLGLDYCDLPFVSYADQPPSFSYTRRLP